MIVIGIVVIGILIYTVSILQCNFGDLERPQMLRKISELVTGLRTDDRVKLLNPVFFLIRRLLYASTVVFMANRSYFQIQFTVFQCSLFMLYIGYFRPFILPSVNLMELINETFTL